MKTRRRWFPRLGAGLLVTTLVVGTLWWRPGFGEVVAAAAPSTPTKVCGVASELDGPTSAPEGAVVVRPGSTLPDLVSGHGPGTTFWLERGTFTLGPGQYDQVAPTNGDTFVGAPGAVIDGRHRNLYAFTGQARDVTIEYLTIKHFGQAGDNNNEGVVNHDSGSGWRIEHDTVEHSAGAGVMLGSDNVLSHDCLLDNGQYGFSAYRSNGVRDLSVNHLTVTDNEIAGNDTDNWEKRDLGCGCTGGGKFWDTRGARVIGNYVHDNHSVGLWADTNNVGFQITGNYISDNFAEGVIYEISYNARIADNTFVRNAIGEGPTNPGFPSAAVYLSESGSDRRVGGPFAATLAITGNVFDDNWGGVVLWESADRFCGSPDNTSSDACTLVDPSQANLKTCDQADLDGAKPGQAPVDYYADCRWKTQNVSVTDNRFTFHPAQIGADCTLALDCGLQGLLSQWGSDPSWSPYMGEVVEHAITRSQGNHFADNVYVGPWRFMVHDQGTVVRFSTWQRSWGQDTGSTLAGTLRRSA